MKLLNIIINFFLLAATAVILPSCAVNPVTGEKQIMLMSEEQEIAMGREYDPQVIATFGEYKNDELLAFITAKGTEMGKISHRPQLTYHFRILDSPVVNAFAVPGGYLYFTRGILAQFNNEAELIGVLGHEMGHVAARHTVSQQSKQQLGQLILIGGMIASEKFREFGQYAMQGMQLLFLKFSRDAERQADKIGVEYASKLQYDGQQMANFFKTLSKMNASDGPGGVPTFMSTHPDPDDRLTNVTQMAQQWKEELKYEKWQVNEDNYLRMIDGMVYGEDPRQGFVENNVFYHPELKFSFPVPSGWAIENSPSQVQMAPEGGAALLVFSLSDQTTAQAAAEKALQQLQLKPLESKKVTVNGMPAIAVISDQVSQNEQTGQEQRIRVLSYFIEYGGKTYLFHGVTDYTNFNTFYRGFETTMLKFNRLTDPAKLNKQPKRIKLQTVKKSGTLASALSSFGIDKSKMGELALLNNMELTDQVQAGKRLKIIGE